MIVFIFMFLLMGFILHTALKRKEFKKIFLILLDKENRYVRNFMALNLIKKSIKSRIFSNK